MDITRPIEQWLADATLDNGVLTVFVRHTSASLVMQENADPEVRGDLDRFFARLVRGTWQGIYLWEHRLRAHRRDVALHVIGE